uniref:Helicase ATP-binding domain-containing protein n=1 Tax=Strongyloides papillosus TaxID=174720 RepID=A0A0N5CIT5_STREA
MKRFPRESTVFFECIQTRHLSFSITDNVEDELVDLWRRDNLFNKILIILYREEQLDEAQQILARSICSNKKFITCLAPAGCSKTQSICSVLLICIEDKNKRSLFVGPTNKSCEAIIERFISWAPDPSKILIIKFRAAMVRHPDSFYKSVSHYKRKGIHDIIDKMESKNRQMTQDYFNKLNITKENLKNTETFLPSMIMKYIKSQIFVCTIDLVIKGLSSDYTKEGFDYIIIDEAFQLRTATAIVLKSLLIDTIDAFQEHEKNFFIISTCRSSLRNGNIVTDFYDLTNHACVAFTRLKLGFFFFGNALMMISTPTWNNIVTYMDDRNTVVEFNLYELSKVFLQVNLDGEFIQTHINNLKRHLIAFTEIFCVLF